MINPVPPDSVSKFAAACMAKIDPPAGARVLDAPCGFGRHAHWLAEAGHRVTAVDLDEKRVRAAAAQLIHAIHPIEWLVADLERDLPLAHGTFDVMVVVHYYSDHIVDGARRMLRSGGYLIFETFGAQGQNWQSLPAHRAVPLLLRDGFEIFELSERRVGPTKDRAVVRALAKRLSSA